MHTHPLRSVVHPNVATLDFGMLRAKLLRGDEGDAFDPETLARAEHEYRVFLTVRHAHPDEILVPTRLVDRFWHAHILDTVAYARDCDHLFGRYLHHFPYFGIRSARDAADMQSAFERTRALYLDTVGAPPGGEGAARCGDDHVCHAPSDCACRCPSACK